MMMRMIMLCQLDFKVRAADTLQANQMTADVVDGEEFIGLPLSDQLVCNGFRVKEMRKCARMFLKGGCKCLLTQEKVVVAPERRFMTVMGITSYDALIVRGDGEESRNGRRRERERVAGGFR